MSILSLVVSRMSYLLLFSFVKAQGCIAGSMHALNKNTVRLYLLYK